MILLKSKEFKFTFFSQVLGWNEWKEKIPVGLELLGEYLLTDSHFPFSLPVGGKNRNMNDVLAIITLTVLFLFINNCFFSFQINWLRFAFLYFQILFLDSRMNVSLKLVLHWGLYTQSYPLSCCSPFWLLESPTVSFLIISYVSFLNPISVYVISKFYLLNNQHQLQLTIIFSVLLKQIFQVSELLIFYREY